MVNQIIKNEAKIGEQGYVNQNCWLAKNLGRAPSKRCQYCESKFRDCLFERYLLMTLIMVCLFLIVSYLVEGEISKVMVTSIFVIVIAYGYFFSTSTEKIIISSFEEKKAKNAFKELSGSLQQKVDEQIKDIKKAYETERQAHEELKKLDDAKTQFMMVTQHHLRTPLTVTMGYFDLLVSGVYGKLPEKFMETVKLARKSTEKEIKVVDDLLDISAFQLGKGGTKIDSNVSIKDILEEIINDLKPEADNKNIYLKFQNSNNIVNISADKNQLKMALQNIVDNAIKYTSNGGVEVSSEFDNNKLIIKVKDTGIGVSKDDQKGLFEKTFERSKEAWKANAVGKGIGLYLSAKIIQAHKGTIRVESEGENKGSTFYIELPVQ